MKDKKKLSKILMALAALALGTLFLFPMWRITLIAPQYPDGVTMYIWINQITGQDPGTLQNINILNHYVGMKYIEPDSIPELQYFQYIIMAMMALGLAAAAFGNSRIFLAWSILLIILGILGMYDFYLWEYDYGHNLSDTAPIKVEGQSYQPPLFGSKYLLNFLAESYPHTSGWFVGLSLILGLVAAKVGWKR
jgi:copper chaperone NosL